MALVPFQESVHKKADRDFKCCKWLHGKATVPEMIMFYVPAFPSKSVAARENIDAEQFCQTWHEYTRSALK